MDKIKSTLKKLWADESGQGATEYILILVVVTAIVFAFKDKIVEIVGNKTKEVGDTLSKSIGDLQN